MPGDRGLDFFRVVGAATFEHGRTLLDPMGADSRRPDSVAVLCRERRVTIACLARREEVGSLSGAFAEVQQTPL